MAQAAERLGMKAAWSLDLTVMDDDGEPWDFTVAAKKAKAMRLLKEDCPALLVTSPMCGPFSSWQGLNYENKSDEEIKELLAPALAHLKFTMDLCYEQYRRGRYFVFEHPAGASSWSTAMVTKMLELEGMRKVTFDFCMLGMRTPTADGPAPAMKPTSILTNSSCIADLLRRFRCHGLHSHVRLEGGRASACERYPDQFCEAVMMGLQRELDQEKWVENIYKKADASGWMHQLMAVVEKLEVPPSDEDDTEHYKDLYDGLDFIDDLTGEPLEKEFMIAARKLEIDFFKKRGVYRKVPRQQWMRPISTRWIDTNKGDDVRKDYRARLVGREMKAMTGKRDDIFAATPPLESLRFVLSIAASNQWNDKPYLVMATDVKRAYFYAPARRPIYVEVPEEDKVEGEGDVVGELQLSLYGTRDAAVNWSNAYTKFLKDSGFEQGRGSPCNFLHPERGIRLTVHGDDFTSVGSEEDLAWLDAEFKRSFEVKSQTLGPEARHSQQIRVLNRIISWTAEGIVYEPDPRHAERVMAELGLEAARAVTSPGCREDIVKMVKEQENSRKR
jgi:hypothetical protein